MQQTSDSELMARSLASAGGVTEQFRRTLFERFFSRHPERRHTFLNLEASSIRMTEETIEMMLGLSQDEDWVWPLVAELVFTHRSYGRLPWEEYKTWMSYLVDEISVRSSDNWDDATEHAWRHWADQLLALINNAREEWEKAMPPGYVDELSTR